MRLHRPRAPKLGPGADPPGASPRPQHLGAQAPPRPATSRAQRPARQASKPNARRDPPRGRLTEVRVCGRCACQGPAAAQPGAARSYCCPAKQATRPDPTLSAREHGPTNGSETRTRSGALPARQGMRRTRRRAGTPRNVCRRAAEEPARSSGNSGDGGRHRAARRPRERSGTRHCLPVDCGWPCSPAQLGPRRRERGRHRP